MYLAQQYKRYVAMDKTCTSPYDVSDTYRARVVVPEVRDTFMPPAEKSVVYTKEEVALDFSKAMAEAVIFTGKPKDKL
eukprot:2707595-Pleurochrysis_carterae.AAC.1